MAAMPHVALAVVDIEVLVLPRAAFAGDGWRGEGPSPS